MEVVPYYIYRYQPQPSKTKSTSYTETLQSISIKQHAMGQTSYFNIKRKNHPLVCCLYTQRSQLWRKKVQIYRPPVEIRRIRKQKKIEAIPYISSSTGFTPHNFSTHLDLPTNTYKCTKTSNSGDLQHSQILHRKIDFERLGPTRLSKIMNTLSEKITYNNNSIHCNQTTI